MGLISKYQKERRYNDNFFYWFIRKVLSHIPAYVKWHNYQIGEQKKCFGNSNPDITFYVIRPGSKTAGLMSIHNHVLLGIKEALSRNMVPVVDFCNYTNMYLNPSEIGKKNSWEYYFLQPTQYTLQDVYNSQNVVIDELCYNSHLFDYSKESIKFQHELTVQYTKLNSTAKEYINHTKQLLFPKDSRILGVLGRGTDYSSLHPKEHAIVPSIEELIIKTKEKLDEWHCDYIFLATEDKVIYETFLNSFNNQLIVNETQRFDHNTKGKKLADIHQRRNSELYLRGLEYLTSVYLLSECQCLITSRVGGGLGALKINGNQYEHTFIFDLGTYK